MIRQQVFKLQSSDYWLWVVDNACTVPKSFYVMTTSRHCECLTHLLFSRETKAVSLKHSLVTSGIIFGAVSADDWIFWCGQHWRLARQASTWRCRCCTLLSLLCHVLPTWQDLFMWFKSTAALCTCVCSRSSPETTRVYSWLALCVIGRGTLRIVFCSVRWSSLAWIASRPFAPCQYVNRKMLACNDVKWWESVIMRVDWCVVYLAEWFRMSECAWLREYVIEVEFDVITCSDIPVNAWH